VDQFSLTALVLGLDDSLAPAVEENKLTEASSDRSDSFYFLF